MNPKQLRPWWLRKRVLFALAFPIALGLAVVIAFLNSDGSKVVVYNLTGHTLPPLLVQACGQSRTFTAVEDEASVCLTLKSAGESSPVHLALAKDPPWTWEGESIRPHGGMTVTIRIRPDNQVEAYQDVSWWRQWWK